ncbi:hypothetical protein ACQ4LK_26035, partial [Bacillus pumilus]
RVSWARDVYKRQGQKHSFLYQGLINYIISKDPFIPINGGITFPIEVISPKGTLVHLCLFHLIEYGSLANEFFPPY